MKKGEHRGITVADAPPALAEKPKDRRGSF
jgi:hypothetical protein